MEIIRVKCRAHGAGLVRAEEDEVGQVATIAA